MGTGAGEGPPVRWENGGRRRRRMGADDDDDDDEEYVVEEEEEEDYAEALSASSAGEDGEDSDAEYQVDEEEEEVDTPRPTRPAKGGDRGRKGKADLAAARSRRRKYEEDEDYEEEVDEDDEEVEEYHDELDEEEDEEEAPPRPKRPAKPRGRGRNLDLSPVAERSQPRRHRDDMVFDPELDDMDFDPELDDEEVEEEEERPQRPKSLAKCHGHDRNVELSPVAERSHHQRCKDDTDFDPELDDTDFDPELDDEDVEEEKEVLPQPQSIVKCRGRGQNVELSPVAERSHQRRRDVDMDFDPELDDEEVEEEEALPRPKNLARSRHRGQNVELSPVAERSHQRRHEVDMDFDPELDDEDDEADEDIDFDPEVDEEDEFEDEDEELGAIRARKVTAKDPVKRKSFSKRRSQNKKNKKKNTGSKVSRKKVGSSKGRKSAPVRRRRKRTLIDQYEEDDDFIVEDQEAVSRNPRKKARTGTGRKTEDLPVSIEEEKWPTVESDTSEFEFATSDEEPDDVVSPVVEPATVRKGRKKRRTVYESSSDSEFVVSDKELEDLRENEPPPKALPMLPTQIRRISITRNGEDKGKKKEEPEEAGKPICGICLSEEQRTTVQGVLNCCSHYFCFACIMEWSRVESRCPLCKQRFTTITKSSKVDLGLGQRKAVIRVEERDQVYQPTEEEIRRWLDPYENVVCIECNQGGDDSLMLLCDICDSSAHTYCVGLGNEVPEGNWYCGGCRLSDEGPSYTRRQHTVGYERPNYRGPVNGSSVGFGVAAPSGTFERSPSINSRRSFQGIDLNLSPTEIPGEFHPAESQVATDGVSPPSGMRATVSGRRQIHRYIRILLAGPRQNRPEMLLNGLHNSGAVPRPEPNRRHFRSSSEANTSQVLPDGIQNQHNGLPFIQAHSNLCSKSPR
ncbi:hypothetical protein ACP4OV_004817 [Aristida adscensionis]